ncbi:MAG: 6-carboxytetrahydropterin synthase [Candidatus Omnitrophica bacterium]|jgi:6-pyruvoyltetrahydropterin/6-carboxytetrahydropterin synthase|nr:6-carboxytetrahydropterin synthase [Candidatus Omnitrophota bacterium]
MYQVTKEFSFSYGHRLIKHKGKCERYHGHNGLVQVVCEGPELNDNRMLIDFDIISKALKGWIDEEFDHRMILNEQDPMTELLKKKGEKYFSMPDDPTAEALAKVIFDHAAQHGLPVKQVIVWETPTSRASYQK